VIQATTSANQATLKPVIGARELIAYQQLVRQIPLAEEVGRHALALVRSTRPDDDSAADVAKKWLAYGASVRAAQFIVLGAKARAATRGNLFVSYADVREMARPVLRHRLLRNFQAESEQVTVDQIIDGLLAEVPTPA